MFVFDFYVNCEILLCIVYVMVLFVDFKVWLMFYRWIVYH